MQNQKRTLYRRTYRPLVVPEDNDRPISWSPFTEPFGPWLTGVESVQFVNGFPVTVVTLQDGKMERLSELVTREIIERRAKDRDPWKARGY
jgi:hypothetical protein